MTLLSHCLLVQSNTGKLKTPPELLLKQAQGDVSEIPVGELYYYYIKTYVIDISYAASSTTDRTTKATTGIAEAYKFKHLFFQNLYPNQKQLSH
jgi:hypothetical protein